MSYRIVSKRLTGEEDATIVYSGPDADVLAKRKAMVKVIPYQSEILRMASKDHEVEMKVLKLKEEYYRQKSEKSSSTFSNKYM